MEKRLLFTSQVKDIICKHTLLFWFVVVVLRIYQEFSIKSSEESWIVIV